MKKFIYGFLLALVVTVTVSSCTEEEVKPSTELENGGGGASDPIKG